MHILVIVSILALLIVIAEHFRLASRVAAAEAKLKAIDTRIAAALKNVAATIVTDVQKVETAL